MKTTNAEANEKAWFDPYAAADYIGTDPRTLGRWASMTKAQGRLIGPKFATMSDPACERELRIYRRQWLDDFIAANYSPFDATAKREQDDSHMTYSGNSPPAGHEGQGGPA